MKQCSGVVLLTRLQEYKRLKLADQAPDQTLAQTHDAAPADREAPLEHILSVDVEDYFQVEAFAGQVTRDSWNQWPSRVVGNTQRVLDLFDVHGAKGTFFF